MILIVWPWVIAIAALRLAALLIFLALRLKRLQARVATFGEERR